MKENDIQLHKGAYLSPFFDNDEAVMEMEKRLQRKADLALAFQYDGSEDWWTYADVGDVDGYFHCTRWGICIWDADVVGDGSKSGLQITAYPCNGADGEANYSVWINLDVNRIGEVLAGLRGA